MAFKRTGFIKLTCRYIVSFFLLQVPLLMAALSSYPGPYISSIALLAMKIPPQVFLFLFGIIIH